MAFYGSMAQVYDAVFPVTEAKLSFIRSYLKPKDMVLDIGCATGSLLNGLSEDIGQGLGIDLDTYMIEAANGHYQAAHVAYRVGDMTLLDQTLDHGLYDVVTCLGNTLVHVADPKVVLRGIYDLLNDQGIGIVQILNYDYIQRESIDTLPLIDNDTIRFERYYHWVSPHTLDFETILTIKASEATFHNQVTLYPIYPMALETMCRQIGFQSVTYYKNYDKEAFDDNGLPLIIVLKKVRDM